MTNEAMVDRWIDQIVDDHKGSDTCLKSACIRAAHVVGSYSGATGVIAKRTRRSVASVENWAHAFRLYRDLRENGNRKIVRRLWRDLPASHWWLAYDVQVSGYDALYYLLGAFQNKWSGRDMLKEFDADRNAGNAPLVFRRACLSFYGLSLELMKRAKDLTKEQFAAVNAVGKAFLP